MEKKIRERIKKRIENGMKSSEWDKDSEHKSGNTQEHWVGSWGGGWREGGGGLLGVVLLEICKPTDLERRGAKRWLKGRKRRLVRRIQKHKNPTVRRAVTLGTSRQRSCKQLWSCQPEKVHKWPIVSHSLCRTGRKLTAASFPTTNNAVVSITPVSYCDLKSCVVTELSTSLTKGGKDCDGRGVEYPRTLLHRC